MTTTTTTNYGWTIPQDSELVKDGAAAIRTLGNAADASLKTVSDAALKATIVDAKGDLIAATAADTVARVAVGTDGQVLTADAASAAGVKWATASAGSLTLLSTTTLSGTTTTISSINQGYKNLFIQMYGMTWNTGNDEIEIKFNGGTAGAYGSDTLSSQSTTSGVAGGYLNVDYTHNLDRTYTGHLITLQIFDYTNTAIQKSALKTSFFKSSAGNYHGNNGGFTWNNTSALSSLDIKTVNGYTLTAGTVKIYGVN